MTTDYENLPRQSGYQSFIRDLGPMVLDRYALTMTYAAWKAGETNAITTSNIFCRSYLNNGERYKDSATDEIRDAKIPYLISAGLGLVAEWVDGWAWKDDDLRHLAQQRVDDGKGNLIRTFPDEFLTWLSQQKLSLTIEAVPEGQMLAPFEPLMRITGPWWQQMCIEASTLEMVSSSTNLTTVASQVRLAAQREGKGAVEASATGLQKASLAEMSLRRSLSIGSIQSSRAAFIAGWDATSNEYAARCYGIPAMGTFAHSWVMLHDTEEEAFEKWAMAYPGSTVFLTDTYHTLDGVRNAVRTCKKHHLKLKGLRFDSGNMGDLSVKAHAVIAEEAARLMSEAGYEDSKLISADGTAYLASDSVTVKVAASLFAYASMDPANPTSRINSMGIGTTVAVNRDQPVLDFVMKQCAVHDPAKAKKVVREVLKISETEKKTSLPGMINVIRFFDRNGFWAGDTIIPDDLDIGEGRLNRDVSSISTLTEKQKVFPKGTRFIRVLEPWMVDGKMVQTSCVDRDSHAILMAAREQCAKTMASLHPVYLRLPPTIPHMYVTGIAKELIDKRSAIIALIDKTQGKNGQGVVLDVGG